MLEEREREGGGAFLCLYISNSSRSIGSIFKSIQSILSSFMHATSYHQMLNSCEYCSHADPLTRLNPCRPQPDTRPIHLLKLRAPNFGIHDSKW